MKNTGAFHMAADTRRALEGSHESHHCPSCCTPGIRERRRGPALQARPGSRSTRGRRPAWFLDAKFGIFIHWGVYSVPAWGKARRVRRVVLEHAWPTRSPSNDRGGSSTRRHYGEDFDYQDFAPQFRAELFDADQWADLFARSGAKYVVPDLQAPRGLLPLAQRRGQPDLGPARGTPSRSARSATCWANWPRPCARTRPEVRLLLLALRVVQPALADRPARATSPST